MSVSISDGTTSVAAEEIIAASLTRPLRREALEVSGDDAYLFNSGTPGKLAGQIVYLCGTLAAALALDALYQGAETLTLTTGAALDGLTHRAVGKLELTAERAVPGHPSKWLLKTEIREV